MQGTIQSYLIICTYFFSCLYEISLHTYRSLQEQITVGINTFLKTKNYGFKEINHWFNWFWKKSLETGREKYRKNI